MEGSNCIKAPVNSKQFVLLAGLYNIVWAFLFYLYPSLPRFSREWAWSPAGDAIYLFLVAALGLALIWASRKPQQRYVWIAVAFFAKLLGFLLAWGAYFVAQGTWEWALWSLLHDLIWLPGLGAVAYQGFFWSMKPKRKGRQGGVLPEFDQYGDSFGELSFRNPVMLVFLRHFGCTFCREMLVELASRKEEIKAMGLIPVFVHLADAMEAEKYLAAYGWTGARQISDPDAYLYESFHLERASFKQVFGWKNWKRGVSVGLFKGLGLGKAVGDGFQMLGVFVIVKGTIEQGFRHRFAGDLPPYDELMSCALASAKP